jgi:hypothetical protein
MRPALLSILVLAKARAKRLYFSIPPERATQASAKSDATRRAHKYFNRLLGSGEGLKAGWERALPTE